MPKKVFLIRLARPSLDACVAPPLGLMYLASSVRSAGSHEVAIWDMKIEGPSIKDAVDAARDFGPGLVGVSLMSFEAPLLGPLAEGIKQVLPGVQIITGGPHPSAFPEGVLADPAIDACVMGEGELSIREIIDRVEQGEGLAGIDGTAARENGAITVNPRTGFITDLDSLPMPAWDLIPMERYFAVPRMGNIYRHKPYMVTFTSRSCPFKCVYCHNIFGKKFRARSPESVLEEIRHLRQEYGIREIQILDDVFNFDRDRAKRIAWDLASADFGVALSFVNGVRGDLMDQELLEALKKAGTFRLTYAVETASKRLQRVILKNLKIDRVFDIIEQTDRQGILSHGFFMLGFPGETREEMEKTVKFALDSKLHTASFLRVIAFKGTELHDMALDLNLDLPDDFGSFEFYRTHVNLSAVPEHEVTRLEKRAYRSFYLNPRRMARLLRFMPNKARLLPRLSAIFLLRGVVKPGGTRTPKPACQQDPH